MSSLPSDWQMKPLKEVATLQRGFDLPVNDRVGGDVPIFAANGPVGTHNVAKIKVLELLPDEAEHLVKSILSKLIIGL